ncbi:unnamed protein product, partial [Sphagnum compactum]
MRMWEGLSLHDDLLHVLANMMPLFLEFQFLRNLKGVPADPELPASSQGEGASHIMPVNLKLSTSKPALACPTQEIAKKPVAVSSSATNDSHGPLLDLLSAGHTLMAQQRSMIYGEVQPQSPQLPQSPLGHQPQAQQTQNTYSPVQQQQQQPAVRTPPPWQD